MKNYHCCATCQHYMIIKSSQGVTTQCRRLGFDTKPRYQFSCWNPKEHIQRLLERDPTHKDEDSR
jgi:hypothetical protein